MIHLVIFSHKPCWADSASASGFSTDGGFPLQMAAISELFDRTTLVIPRSRSPRPPGLTPLDGKNLDVDPFPEPPGTGWRRKLGWILGSVVRLPRLWHHAGRGDAVHAAVPGDVGFVGLVLALLRRRRIFVRHCGTWGNDATLADRLLHRLLVRVAGERCIVFATGGGEAPPSQENPAIRWIFSTSLSASEVADPATTRRSEPPRLIHLGRLTAGKNAAATIRALAELRRDRPDLLLDVVGRGPEEERLRALVRDLELEEAVVFHGNLDHDGVMERLRRARVLVFPTQVAEGFPKAVLEALASGVPVVAPRVSVLPHLLRDGGGLLLDDVDPRTVASAVRRLLDDAAEWSRHAEAGPRIARRHTLEAWSDAIRRRLESAWGTRLAGENRSP